MNLKVNQTGTLSFGEKGSSKVRIVEIEPSRSGIFPTDYWFEYLEEETNRPLIHPDFGKSDIIKSEILLPEGLVKMVFTPDLETSKNKNLEESLTDEYEIKLNTYLKEKMLPENYEEGKALFRKLEKLLTKQEIADKYFK